MVGISNTLRSSKASISRWMSGGRPARPGHCGQADGRPHRPGAAGWPRPGFPGSRRRFQGPGQGFVVEFALEPGNHWMVAWTRRSGPFRPDRFFCDHAGRESPQVPEAHDQAAAAFRIHGLTGGVLHGKGHGVGFFEHAQLGDDGRALRPGSILDRLPSRLEPPGELGKSGHGGFHGSAGDAGRRGAGARRG